MRLFKALFGGLFAVIGILIGGVWDTLTGQARSAPPPDLTPAAAVTQTAPVPTPSAPVSPAPITPAAEPPTSDPPAATSDPADSPIATASVSTAVAPAPLPAPPVIPAPLQPAASTPAATATYPPNPFGPTVVAAPRPTRRPGKGLDPFREMARTIPSARRV